MVIYRCKAWELGWISIQVFVDIVVVVVVVDNVVVIIDDDITVIAKMVVVDMEQVVGWLVDQLG